MMAVVCLALTSAGCRDDEAETVPSPGAAPRPHYGELMSEVGRRFEVAGRAALAGRWELAGFELDELGEVFEELPGAVPPEETGGVNLRGLEQAFTGTNLPALRKAVGSQDAEGFASAFSGAAATCNGCHRETSHAFIEIPAEPGAGVPRLDPIR